ncbi:hypothetical protein BDV25DRAFT_130171 [Aspergillus avenaceus]|uniref:ER-bound oxygenase mpaB/mpaB'/Rubber oxygenase catalytic domain-containing protein n=1 Tax=Aspergillus avenaceus TaxID=36643 RepID=A0A5N6TTM2_ASPAV|nr:hypothetical protein BDV25DRAFT_130171 [Aspergillus avenaceus]
MHVIIGAAVVGGYLLLVQVLRFRRRDRIKARFGSGRPLSSMTVKEAHGIMQELRELEFPFTMRSSTRMSTLKTGAIPTVAKLFLATGQRTDKNNTKRSADTEVLMNEIHDREAGSESQLMAYARMNYMHGRYRKAGKIHEEDMVHTLGSAVVEIFRSIERYEWRPLTDVEMCAVGVFHKAMGNAMEIPLELLPSCGEGWADGIQFARELCEYTKDYRKRAAYATDSTLRISKRLMGLETSNYPAPLKPIVERVIASRLEENIRLSMGFQDPGVVLSSIITGLVAIRKLILRYLSLPRPDFMAVRVLDAAPDPSTGRYAANRWLDNPWYIKTTFFNRWSIKALTVRLFGTGNVPTKNSAFRDAGYNLRTIGPDSIENKGQADVEAILADLKKREIPAGCPFHA